MTNTGQLVVLYFVYIIKYTRLEVRDNKIIGLIKFMNRKSWTWVNVRHIIHTATVYMWGWRDCV